MSECVLKEVAYSTFGMMILQNEVASFNLNSVFYYKKYNHKVNFFSINFDPNMHINLITAYILITLFIKKIKDF